MLPKACKPVHKKQSNQGQFLLVSVFTIGIAILMVVSLFAILSLNSSKITLAASQAAQAEALSIACAEEVLNKIHQSPTYVGTDIYTFDGNECNYSVDDVLGTDEKKIDMTITVKDIVKFIGINLSVQGNDITIINWYEFGGGGGMMPV